MSLSHARQPIAAAAASLAVFALSVACFLPPLNHYTTNSVLLIVLLALSIGVSYIIHLIFIGMAARRLGRSPALWVIVAALFMPVASIIGLIMFEWFSEQKDVQPVQ
ncbi:hypothetical protein ACLB1G_20360 [Oxalobacteraceae bacterium A2-2]